MRYSIKMVWILFFCCFANSITYASADRVSIGVLAFNGKQQAIVRWQPTADYLSKHIPDYQFQIEPLTHEEFDHKINKGNLDFILTNPGHYVRLEVSFGATRIATFKSKFRNQVLTQFSSVIFTRKDSQITTLHDLKGKSFAAVSEAAFGGFQLAQKALMDNGINALDDFKVLWLGFPHTDIVKAVMAGKANAGTVRSGILEKMIAQGNLDQSQVRILAAQDNSHFPQFHSVALYPEWPFSKLPDTNSTLAKHVAIALLQMKGDDKAALSSEGAGWTIPLDYTSVHDVFRSLQIEPYPPTALDISKFWLSYRHWIITVCLLFLTSLFALFRLFRANQQLKTTQSTLYHHQTQLEETVKQRTEALYQANIALQQDIKSRIRSEQTLNEGCEALQNLYRISLRNDLNREQRLQSMVDLARQYLGVEFALLSSFENDNFKACTSSPGRQMLSAPLSKLFAQQAVHDNQIVIHEDEGNWLRYIVCPIYVAGELHCLFECATSYQYSNESGYEKEVLPSELSFRILNLISQWIGNEIIMVETEKKNEEQYRESRQRFSHLTPREQEVLKLLVQGESTKSMARMLSISTKTIELHRSNLLRKTEVKSSIELVKLAILAGMSY